MKKDEVVLCASSSYEQKYYLNNEFDGLPDLVKDELKAMCVLYTEDIGGILELVYDEEGSLNFVTTMEEGDLLYDDIGSILKVKQLREQKKELLEALETYFKVFYLGMEG